MLAMVPANHPRVDEVLALVSDATYNVMAMPDEPCSSASDGLGRAIAQDLERAGARGVPLAVLEDHLRRARAGAFSEAMDTVKQVAVALIPNSPMVYGWNNAVSESLCRLERLRAFECKAVPPAEESDRACESSAREER